MFCFNGGLLIKFECFNNKVKIDWVYCVYFCVDVFWVSYVILMCDEVKECLFRRLIVCV